MTPDASEQPTDMPPLDPLAVEKNDPQTEEKAEIEAAQAHLKACQELDNAILSGEFKEPVRMLEWIKSQESTSPTIKAAIAKQLAWYKLRDEDEDVDRDPEDESDNMDDAARNERELARQERRDSGL